MRKRKTTATNEVSGLVVLLLTVRLVRPLMGLAVKLAPLSIRALAQPLLVLLTRAFPRRFAVLRHASRLLARVVHALLIRLLWIARATTVSLRLMPSLPLVLAVGAEPTELRLANPAR